MKRLFTLALGFTLSLNIAAQSAEPNWYQVEVIIFAQSDNYGQERNLPPRHLSYPTNRVFVADQSGRPPEGLELLSPLDRQLYRLLIPDALLRYQPADHVTPYHSLPAQQRLLGPEAYSLGRHGDYRILFHDSWFQSLAPASRTPWVVIAGGDVSHGHHELEGSLRVYRSRFLTVETHLWHPHYGQLSATERNGSDPDWQWPALPPRPQPPAPQLPPFLADTIETGTVGTMVNGGNNAADSALAHTAMPELVDLDTLQQTLRIDEHNLYYLDHPRLGMLIRVKALETDDESDGD